MSTLIRIATRGSALAIWQAQFVAAQLCHSDPSIETQITVISTEGDRRVEVPLYEIGGKGVFVKEVQHAVLSGEAEVAVHSAKDLPAVTPEGLCIAAVPPRANPRDALIGSTLSELEHGATVATGSPRRRAQLLALREDLNIVELRGNIDTRLGRLESDPELDAIVMAAAALERLERNPAVVDVLDVGVMIPQVGQGALAVECRSADQQLATLLAAISDEPSQRCVTAERSFLETLGGDCSIPAAGYAVVGTSGALVMEAMLSTSRGIARMMHSGEDPAQVGRELGDMLIDEVGGVSS